MSMEANWSTMQRNNPQIQRKNLESLSHMGCSDLEGPTSEAHINLERA